MENTAITLTDKQVSYFSNLRAKWFDITSYLEEEEIVQWLTILNVDKYAYYFHDKDKWNEDVYENDILIHKRGEDKKPHFHIICIFEKTRRALRLTKLFNTTQIRSIPTTNKLKGSFEYLTHENEDNTRLDKVKYEKSKLITNNLDFFESLVYSNVSNNVMDILDNIINGTPFREMVALYGKDFIFHYNQYKEMAFLISNQEKPLKVIKIMEEIEND